MQHSKQSSSNYTSISQRIPRWCSQTDESSIPLINVPVITQLHDQNFWQWQINKKYIDANYEYSSSSNEMQNGCNKLHMIPIHIYNWAPELVSRNLIISGVNELARPISFIVKKRISSLIFKTENQYSCCLTGKISDSANLPKFIRDKFSNHRSKNSLINQYGIPENWKELCVLWHNLILKGYPEDEVLAASKKKEQEFNITNRRIQTADSDGSTLLVNNSHGRLSEFNAIFEKKEISAADRNIFYQSVSSGNNCVTRRSFYDAKLDESIRNSFIQSDDETSLNSTFTEEDFIESDSPPVDLQADKSCVSNGSDADLIRQLILEFEENPDDTLGGNSSVQNILNEENTLFSDAFSSDDNEIFLKPKKSSASKNKLSLVQENFSILNNDARVSVLKEKTDILPEKAPNNSLKENQRIRRSKIDEILNNWRDEENNSSVNQKIQTDWIEEDNIFPKKSHKKSSISKQLPIQTNHKKVHENTPLKIIDRNNSFSKAKEIDLSNLNNPSKTLNTNEKLPENKSSKKRDRPRKVSLQAIENINTNNLTESFKKSVKEVCMTANVDTLPKNCQNLSSRLKKLPFQTEEEIDRNISLTKAQNWESSNSNNQRKNSLRQSGEQARTDNVFKIPQKVSGKIQKVGHPPVLLFETSFPASRNGSLSSDCSNISISSRGRVRRQTSDFWIGFQSFSSNNSFSRNILANSTELSNLHSTSTSFSSINDNRESSINYSSSGENMSDFNDLDKRSSRQQYNSERFESGETCKEVNKYPGKYVQNQIKRDTSIRKKSNVINEEDYSKRKTSKLRNREEENTENKKMRNPSPKISRTSFELEKSTILTKKSNLRKEQDTNQSNIRETSPKSSKKILRSVKSSNLTSLENNPKNKTADKKRVKRKLYSDNSTSTTEIEFFSKVTKKYPSRNTSIRINYNEDFMPNINFLSNMSASLSNESITEKPKKKNARLEDKTSRRYEKRNWAKSKSDHKSKTKTTKESPRKSIAVEENIRISDNLKTSCFVLISKKDQLIAENTSNCLGNSLDKTPKAIVGRESSTNMVNDRESKEEMLEKSSQKCITLNSKTQQHLDHKLKTRCCVLIPENEQYVTKSTSHFVVENITEIQQKEVLNPKKDSCFYVSKTIGKKKVEKYNKRRNNFNLLKMSAVDLEAYVKKFKKKKKSGKTPNNVQLSCSNSYAEKSQKRRQLFNADKWLQSAECFEMLKKEVGPESKSFFNLKNDPVTAIGP